MNFFEETLEKTNPETSQTTEISLHAMLGFQSRQMIKVQGFLDGQPIAVLIDSRRTHILLDFHLATELKKLFLRYTYLKILVAYGEKIPSVGICKSMSLEMGNTFFTLHFILIYLNGVNWLNTLAPITWDFQHMKMSFVLQKSCKFAGATYFNQFTKNSTSFFLHSYWRIELQNLTGCF